MKYKSKTFTKLLLLLSGRPAAGKSTIARKLIAILTNKYKLKVKFIEFDQWRKKNYKSKAFHDELVEEMLIKINSEVKENLKNTNIVIIESGAYTAAKESRKFLIRNINKVYDVQIICPLRTAIIRDCLRTIRGAAPRLKFVYLQTIFRNLFNDRKIYLPGFNKRLEPIFGLNINTAQKSIQESVNDILNYLEINHLTD